MARSYSLNHAPLLGLLLFLLPTPSSGDGEGVAKPSLTLSEVYDDNLFASPTKPQADYITRLTPGFEGGYHSTRFTFLARGLIEGERFANNTTLNSDRSRDDYGLELSYRPSPTGLFQLSGSNLDTLAPDELTLGTGLEIGRARAQEQRAAISYTAATSPRSSWDVKYHFLRDELAGVAEGQTHEAILTWIRRLSHEDSGTLTYEAQWFVFGSEVVPAHVLLVGWKRDLGTRTKLVLAAGPRYSQNSVAPQAQAALTHTMSRGEFGLAYNRTLGLVVGELGTVSVESASLTLRFKPVRPLRLSLVPEVFRDRRAQFEARVYRLSSDLNLRLARWLTFEASHQLSRQEGTIDSPSALRVARSVLIVRLVVADAGRN
jgi:hypothetical protein